MGLALENSKVDSLSLEVARLKELRNKEEMEVANLRKKVVSLSTLSRLMEVSRNWRFAEKKRGRDIPSKGGHGIDMASSTDTINISHSRSSYSWQALLFANFKGRKQMEEKR